MTTNPSPLLLEVAGLGMRFGAQVVFEDLSFAFAQGAVALVGPNGAGKSTLISLLSGIEQPHSGAIRIAGHDLERQATHAKARLAYVPDEAVAYGFMRGTEWLAMTDALRGRRDAAAGGAAGPLAEGLGLIPHMETRFDAMSLGTRKKFMLLGGLMSPAPLVLLDEPTNGIDADARAFLAAHIRQEAARRLFFFSTHDADFIDATDARRLRLGQAPGRS